MNIEGKHLKEKNPREKEREQFRRDRVDPFETLTDTTKPRMNFSRPLGSVAVGDGKDVDSATREREVVHDQRGAREMIRRQVESTAENRPKGMKDG